MNHIESSKMSLESYPMGLIGIKIKIFRNFWKKNRNHRKGIAITLISITKRNILITLYLG